MQKNSVKYINGRYKKESGRTTNEELMKRSKVRRTFYNMWRTSEESKCNAIKKPSAAHNFKSAAHFSVSYIKIIKAATLGLPLFTYK